MRLLAALALVVVFGVVSWAVPAAARAENCSERASHAAGVPILVDDAAEPAVCEALLAAIGEMPKPHRAKLAKLRVVRQHDLGLPADAPLIYQLYSAATLAYYDIGPHRIVVTDAGVAGKSHWTRQASPAEVAALLAGLADGLGVDPAKNLEGAWAKLTAKVDAEAGRPPKKYPVGDPVILDELIALAVNRLIGAEVTLPAILAHEIGHLVQIHEQGESVRIAQWATLSDWREREHGEPADGFVGGGFASEKPIVALRIALGMSRGKEALYEPRAGKFPTKYAQVDPMEDFAEAYRLRLVSPAKLGGAPEKWVAVNGFEADPAPLGPATLDDGAARLLGYSKGPLVDAAFAVAVLRPYGEALTGVARRLGDGPKIDWPADLPPDARKFLDEQVIDVAGVRLTPSRAALLALARQYVEATEDMAELNRGMGHTDRDAAALAQARQAAEGLPEGYARGAALTVVATDLIATGDLDGAAQVAAEIHGVSAGAYQRANLFASICGAHRKRHEDKAAAAAEKSARAAIGQTYFVEWRSQLRPCTR